MKKQNTGKLAIRVLIGALSGVLVGITVGEYATYLGFLGKAYVQLLAMCVYPYLIASLLHGLGKLDTKTAKHLVGRSWYIFLFAWIIVLSAMMVLSLVFPRTAVPIEIVANSQSGHMDFLSLIVPENFFGDISKNYVPAVVVFTIFYGVAMQRIPHKATFLEIMEQVKASSLTIWNWVVIVAPIGVFALFASASGSMSVKEIEGMLLYIIVFLSGAALFAFWILPMLITAFAPIKYRELMKELNGAFILSLVTTLSVVALPIIAQAIEKFIREQSIHDEKMQDVIGTNISLAYPFAQLGNLKVLLFFYFCSFYFQIDYSAIESWMLPPLTLLSTIGTPSGTVNAVNFLCGVYHMPPTTEDLYVTTTTFTRYGQVALSVMGFTLTALLSTFSFYGKLKLNPRKLFLALGGGLAIILVFTWTLRLIGPGLFESRNLPYLNFSIDAELKRNVSSVVYRPGQAIPPSDYDSAGHSLIDHIRKTGRLQVGYNPGIIPFCYFNVPGELVGFDVAFMYQLAKDMNVKLEFLPFTWPELESDLIAHKFDLAIGGIYVTSNRLQLLSATKPYYESPLAILARGAVAGRLATRENALAQRSLTIGMFDSPVLQNLTDVMFPGNPKVLVNNYFELTKRPDIDMALWTFVQAKAYARSRPGYTAVVPSDFGSPFLFAYFMPPGADQTVHYLDYWLELKQTEGFSTTQEKQWMEGIQPGTTIHRWCLIRDVFHWVG
ncbi:MAG: cation:dicarboxylase symporter family transporter, partial [Bacteroidota bacterium]